MDTGWPVTFWLVQSLLDRGMTVEIASTARRPYACGVLGVAAHVLPESAAPFRAALAGIVRAGDYGRIVLLSGLFDGGRAILTCTSVPVERWPEPTSPSTVQETVADPALSEWLRLFAALDYTGLACMELMSRPDGGYTFIELNPRIWGSVAAFRCIGLDYLGLYTAQLAGKKLMPGVASPGFPPGRRCLVFPAHMKARISRGGCLDPLRHPRLWSQSLRQAPWNRPRLMLALLGSPLDSPRRFLQRWRRERSAEQAGDRGPMCAAGA